MDSKTWQTSDLFRDKGDTESKKNYDERVKAINDLGFGKFEDRKKVDLIAAGGCTSKFKGPPKFKERHGSCTETSLGEGWFKKNVKQEKCKIVKDPTKACLRNTPVDTICDSLTDNCSCLSKKAFTGVKKCRWGAKPKTTTLVAKAKETLAEATKKAKKEVTKVTKVITKGVKGVKKVITKGVKRVKKVIIKAVKGKMRRTKAAAEAFHERSFFLAISKSKTLMRKIMNKVVKKLVNLTPDPLSIQTKVFVRRFWYVFFIVDPKLWGVQRFLNLLKTNWQGKQRRLEPWDAPRATWKPTSVEECYNQGNRGVSDDSTCTPSVLTYIIPDLVINFFLKNPAILATRFNENPYIEPVSDLQKMCDRVNLFNPKYNKKGEFNPQATAVSIPTNELPLDEQPYAVEKPSVAALGGDRFIENDMDSLWSVYEQRAKGEVPYFTELAPGLSGLPCEKYSLACNPSCSKCSENSAEFPLGLGQDQKPFGKFILWSWKQRILSKWDTKARLERDSKFCAEMFRRSVKADRETASEYQKSYKPGSERVGSAWDHIGTHSAFNVYHNCLNIAQDQFFLERGISEALHKEKGKWKRFPNWSSDTPDPQFIKRQSGHTRHPHPVPNMKDEVGGSHLTGGRRRCLGPKHSGWPGWPFEEQFKLTSKPLLRPTNAWEETKDTVYSACWRSQAMLFYNLITMNAFTDAYGKPKKISSQSDISKEWTVKFDKYIVGNCDEKCITKVITDVTRQYEDNMLEIWQAQRPNWNGESTFGVLGRYDGSKGLVPPHAINGNYPDVSHIEHYIRGDIMGAYMQSTDDFKITNNLYNGKLSMLPGTLVLYAIRGDQASYLEKSRYRPIGYRSAPFFYFYEWVECIHNRCNSAMRWNHEACEGKRPEDIYSNEIQNGTLSLRQAQMKLTRRAMEGCAKLCTGKLCSNLKNTPPTCASKIEIKLTFCNTCCCKDGFAGTHIHHNLIQGGINDCGAWFGAIDTAVRVIMSVFRSSLIADRFAIKCYKHM